jgi:hypothetical protein|tara:strand:+ start:643 stop:951 length:309 start_codon:yes stop_codon:yes gene_type:complete
MSVPFDTSIKPFQPERMYASNIQVDRYMSALNQDVPLYHGEKLMQMLFDTDDLVGYILFNPTIIRHNDGAVVRPGSVVVSRKPKYSTPPVQKTLTKSSLNHH